MSFLIGGAPVMGRSLLDLRDLCPGPLAYGRLVVAYFRLLVEGRPGRRRPARPKRLKLRLNGRDRDWWVADAGEIGALWEVFVAGQYAQWLPESAQLVLDVGANVGTATAFFRSRYPDAQIVAVEPEPGAAERLRRNVGEDPKTEVVQAALSDHDGVAQFAQAQWTMRGQLADEATPGTVEVQTLTLGSLRERLDPHAPIDLLKVDTEGGEWRILRSSLAGVRALALEVHEPTPDGRPPDALLAEVAAREGLELRTPQADTIRWLLRVDGDPAAQPSSATDRSS